MSVTFTRIRQQHSPASGNVTPTETTIVGEALHTVSGSEDTYRALGLTLHRAATLLFVASENYGYRAHTEDFVLPGDTVVLNDVTMTVAKVIPIAPDNIIIAARIVGTL